MNELFARLDLWVIALYMLAMLIVGALASRGSRDVEGYAVGHRSMSGLVLGFSVLGTFTSSITFLGLPAKAFQGNWNAYVFGLAMPLAAWIGVTWWVPLYRNRIKLSAFELLYARFGPWARAYADLCYVVLQMIRTATIMLLVAMAVQGTLGFPIIPTLLISGLVVIIYDAVGGIRADVWTDVVQVFVFVFGSLCALAVLLWDPPGGPTEFFERIPAGAFSLGEFFPWDTSQSVGQNLLANLSQPTILVIFLYGLTENLRNYGTDQNYVQRIMAAESQSAAGRSIWIGALCYLPVSAVFCMIGTGLAVHYQAHPDRLPVGLKADDVFPHFMRTELHPAICGFLISGVMAAAMSTIDSCLNSISTLFLVDVVRPLRRGAPRLPEIWTLRLCTVAMGALGTGTAVGMYLLFKEEQAKTIMDIWWQYAGTVGGGLFGLFLLAWLMPRLPNWGAALAVLSTIPVLVWGTFMRADTWGALQCPLHPNLVGISATLGLLIVASLIYLLVQRGMVMPNPRVQTESGV